MNRVLEQARTSGKALADALRNPGIRRLEIAWYGVNAAEFAFVVALGIFAFARGGAPAVGLLGVVLYLPPMLSAPLSASLGDKYPRKAVMSIGLGVRFVLTVLLAVAVFGNWPLTIVYVLAAVNMATTTTFWALHLAVIPSLARSPEEMTAANAASSTSESIGALTGPLIAAAILAFSSVGTVLIVVAIAFGLAALVVAGIKMPAMARSEQENDEADAGGVFKQVLGGFRHLARERDSRVVLLLNGLQNVAQAAAGVMAVVAALTIFHGGDSAVGLLNAAIGAGAMVGALGGVLLVGRRALAAPLGATMLVVGAALLLVGGVPLFAVAMISFVVVGAALPVSDICATTLIQRMTPDQFLGRVFGVLDSAIWAGWAIGAALTGWLIKTIGIRWSLATLGVLLPAYAIVRWQLLSRIDGAAKLPEKQIALLRRIPLFAPLPAPALEGLARRLEFRPVKTGDVVIREGDEGDRYYVIDDGTFDVSVGGEIVRTLGAGDSFGEIALLRDIPRTATVTAVSDGAVYALEREPFIDAVTGHTLSHSQAEAVVASHLDEDLG